MLRIDEYPRHQPGPLPRQPPFVAPQAREAVEEPIYGIWCCDVGSHTFRVRVPDSYVRPLSLQPQLARRATRNGNRLPGSSLSPEEAISVSCYPSLAENPKP